MYIELDIDTRKIGPDQAKRVIASSTGARIGHTQLDATYIAKCRYRGTDADFVLPEEGPLAEFRRQVTEGQDSEAMVRKVRALVDAAGDNPAAKKIGAWLATGGAKDLTVLHRAVTTLRGEKAPIAA